MIRHNKKGGVIVAIQQQSFWIMVLTAAVLLSAVVTVLRVKDSYTKFHHKINLLGYDIKAIRQAVEGLK